MSKFDDIAAALASADWSNVSIGNKAIILAAIDALGTASRRDYELRAGLRVVCPYCGGEGANEIHRPQHDDPGFCEVVKCTECNGTGRLTARHNTAQREGK